MKKRPVHGRPQGKTHKPLERRASAAKRGYGRRWQKARIGFLTKHPLCIMCLAKGRSEPATVVDHIKPHKGDMTLFWDRSNWQPVCTVCHARLTVQYDGGFGNETKEKPKMDQDDGFGNKS